MHGLDRAEIVRAGRADFDRRSVGQKRVHLAGPVYYLRRAHGGLPIAGSEDRARGDGVRVGVTQAVPDGDYALDVPDPVHHVVA